MIEREIAFQSKIAWIGIGKGLDNGNAGLVRLERFGRLTLASQDDADGAIQACKSHLPVDIVRFRGDQHFADRKTPAVTIKRLAKFALGDEGMTQFSFGNSQIVLPTSIVRLLARELHQQLIGFECAGLPRVSVAENRVIACELDQHICFAISELCRLPPEFGHVTKKAFGLLKHTDRKSTRLNS